MNLSGIKAVATAVRTLSIDAVQSANSGHPGQPMGCAELGATIFGEILSHYPRDPAWMNRDRFVLSAGHGCMLLYSLLHLSGYDIYLQDIKNLRRLNSKATGHPEFRTTPGVEMTTGPLGQGLASAVGMAIAERMLAARFNTRRKIIDYYTYALVGDGDLMEGVSYEASSLAGHLGLGKLVVFFDSNGITIEGSTKLCFTEDIKKRFRACNWRVLQGSAYDIKRIIRLSRTAKQETHRPTLIIMSSMIAKGSATLAGSHKAHGSPLGEKEVKATKIAMGVPENSSFYIPNEAIEYFKEQMIKWEERYKRWQDTFDLWSKENPERYDELRRFRENINLQKLRLPIFKKGEEIPTRVASGKILAALTQQLPNIVGGSADVSHSTSTFIESMGNFGLSNPMGRNLHFGIREHAMAAIASGIALCGLLRVFCSTYLVFSDYMRPSIRLAALMRLPVIYIFTHDSVFVGEDGPTHQPVEHLASLRTMPGLLVFRPGDAEEASVGWQMAIARKDGPTALILSRQPLRVYEKEDANWEQTLRYGAYVVSDSTGEPQTVIVATGSEVNLAIDTKRLLGSGSVRVVSMMCKELFSGAPPDIRETIIPAKARKVVIEAGVSQGWEGIAGDHGLIHSIETFGESASIEELRELYRFSACSISESLREAGVS